MRADLAALAAAGREQAGYEFVPASAPYSMVSNHSYGVRNTSVYGRYEQSSVDYDAVYYAAPYHLACYAAGNYNSDVPGGFGTIPGRSGAKNVLCVGNTRDAVTSGSRDFAGLAMKSDSSWGPMDDGRLKPDVSANGDGVYSSDFGSDNSYITYSGTSMATPSVAGGVALLQDHALREFGRALKASTIKALLIHTADDIRNPGPDYQSGYGLVNIRAAADRIRAAQQQLAQQNYYHGAITGQLDDATQRALFEFQTDKGLRATGNLDGRTAAALGITTSSVGGVALKDGRVAAWCGSGTDQPDERGGTSFTCAGERAPTGRRTSTSTE